MIKRVFSKRHTMDDYTIAQTMLDLMEDVATFLTSFSNITLNKKRDLSSTNSKMFVFDIDGFDDIHIALMNSGGSGSQAVYIGMIDTNHIDSITSASNGNFINGTGKSWSHNSGTINGYYVINDMGMNTISKNGVLESFTVYRSDLSSRSNTDHSHIVFLEGALVYVYGTSTSYNDVVLDSNTSNRLYVLEATAYDENEKAVFKNAELRSGNNGIRGMFVKLLDGMFQICNNAFYSTASENLVSIEGVLYRQVGPICLFIEDGDTE